MVVNLYFLCNEKISLKYVLFKLYYKSIIKKANAYSEETAKNINKIGLRNIKFLSSAFDILVANRIIFKSADGKYYINNYDNK